MKLNKLLKMHWNLLLYIFIIFIIVTISSSFLSINVYPNPQHLHVDSTSSNIILISEEEIKKLIAIFPEMVTQLKAMNKGLTSDYNELKTNISKSERLLNILKKHNITIDRYLLILENTIEAYNEVKMMAFENSIKEGKHKKFVYREGYMLNHTEKEHKLLHNLQKRGYEEDFPDITYGGERPEPLQNIALIKHFEKELDKIFRDIP